jgi:hypothetical protein
MFREGVDYIQLDRDGNQRPAIVNLDHEVRNKRESFM